jgi:hypothetical protein
MAFDLMANPDGESEEDLTMEEPLYTSTRMHSIQWGEFLLLLADDELALIEGQSKEAIPEAERIHVLHKGKDLYFSKEEFGKYARRGEYLKANRDSINRIRQEKGLPPVGPADSDPNISP